MSDHPQSETSTSGLLGTLIERLKPYIHHTIGCRSAVRLAKATLAEDENGELFTKRWNENPEYPCDCGLEAVLAMLPQQESPLAIQAVESVARKRGWDEYTQTLASWLAGLPPAPPQAPSLDDKDSAAIL